MNPPPKSPTTNHDITPAARGVELLRDFDRLGGREILERILRESNPRKVVEELPDGDLYWIVKKIGADDCLPVLELATPDQWQYLLDLERQVFLTVCRTPKTMERLQAMLTTGKPLRN